MDTVVKSGETTHIIPATPGYLAVQYGRFGDSDAYCSFAPIVAWRIDAAGRARPICVEWAPGDGPGDKYIGVMVLGKGEGEGELDGRRIIVPGKEDECFYLSDIVQRLPELGDRVEQVLRERDGKDPA